MRENKRYTLHLGSMLDVLDTMPDNSIDAVVTDPPYEINFMGKGWDNSGVVFQKDTWAKVLRVLKPGGHLLAFNHSRTFHRMAVAIEDSGFQIRDTIMWMYGSGFPKSHNISMSIDKNFNAEREVVSKAKQWEGWGTALKPSYEPIIMARKPLEGTIADNVLKHGVGGINIDECRVGTEDKMTPRNNKVGQNGVFNASGGFVEPNENGRFPANTIHDGSDEVTDLFPETGGGNGGEPYNYSGREYDNKKTSMFNGDKPKAPSNFNDTGSASRFFYTAKASKKDRDEGLDTFEYQISSDRNKVDGVGANNPRNRTGTPKRNIHPTVKPTDLMQYLVRLVTPKGGTILDPFMGSGSTGKAAMIENNERDAGYHFIGIDLEPEYIEIAEARIEYGINYKEHKAKKEEIEKNLISDNQISFEL